VCLNTFWEKEEPYTETCGILPELEKQKGQPLSDNVIQTVIQFYEIDEFSHLCPGKKDFMSVKQQHEETTRWEHGQKRLLLCNLQELYVAFCEKHPTVSIGFSKLAELCPKHCILAGSRTHTVCVCVIHQNNTHGARSTPYSWFQCKKTFLKKMVCTTQSETCALTQCQGCTDSDAVCKLLSRMDNFEFGDVIIYRQWVMTDCS
jgi:hypothetical protein